MWDSASLFLSLSLSAVTLFELTVVNNWYITMVRLFLLTLYAV